MSSSKLLVAGHLAIDTVKRGNTEFTSLGGPPAYAGLQARNLGSQVTVVTKVGYDFPDEFVTWFARNELRFAPEILSSDKRTTRFRIVYRNGKRELTLLSRCEELSLSQITSLEADGALVSPVAGEVSFPFLKELSQRVPFIYVDPQGFLRRFDSLGRCVLGPLDRSILKYAHCLKMDPEEAAVIAGTRRLERALRLAAQMGPKIVLGTSAREGLLIWADQRLKRIPLVRRVPVDTTGVGDILAGAFLATYLKTLDLVWAVCVGAAASSLAVKGKGIGKLQHRNLITREAKYLMEQVREIGSA